MNVYKRKIKKLIVNPKLFFVDFKNKKINSLDVGGKNNIKIDHPYSIGRIYFNDRVIFEIKNKNVKNKKFSSLFLFDESVAVNNIKIADKIIKNDNDFIGFREGNFYLLSVNNAVDFNIKNYYNSLILNKDWHSGLICEFKNVFITSRFFKLIKVFKESNPFNKIICIINEGDCDFRHEDLYNADYIVSHKSIILQDDILNNIKNINFFKNTDQLITILSNIIKYNGDKPFDYLVPLTRNVPFVENIDDLNEKNIDVFIKLKEEYNLLDLSDVKSFNDYINAMYPYIYFILVKESILQQYENLNKLNKEKDILKLILSDGSKVEVSI